MSPQTREEFLYSLGVFNAPAEANYPLIPRFVGYRPKGCGVDSEDEASVDFFKRCFIKRCLTEPSDDFQTVLMLTMIVLFGISM